MNLPKRRFRRTTGVLAVLSFLALLVPLLAVPASAVGGRTIYATPATYAEARGALRPGDTLILQAGTYTT